MSDPDIPKSDIAPAYPEGDLQNRVRAAVQETAGAEPEFLCPDGTKITGEPGRLLGFLTHTSQQNPIDFSDLMQEMHPRIELRTYASALIRATATHINNKYGHILRIVGIRSESLPRQPIVQYYLEYVAAPTQNV